MMLGALAALAAFVPGQLGPEPWQRELSPLGGPQSEGLVIDGLLEGPFVSWHERGVVAELGQYRHHRRVGLWQTFDEAGRLAAEGEWVNGRPEGTWRSYHPSGAVASEGSYVDGYPSGPWVECFDDGRIFRVTLRGADEVGSEAELACTDNGLEWRVDLGLRFEGCLDDDGQRTGLWRGFHPDGSVAWEENWSEQVQDGEAFSYHLNGAVLHAGAWRYGAPDGLHTWSDADGTPWASWAYVDGHGPWRDYWPSGALKEEGAWVDGERDGLWQSFDPDGRSRDQVLWQGGLRVSARLVDGPWVIEGGYVDGSRDGLWTARDGDGRIAWQGFYAAGLRVGDWRFAPIEPMGHAGDARRHGGVSWALVVTFEDDEERARESWWPGGEVREAVVDGVRVRRWPDGEEVSATDALDDVAALAEDAALDDDDLWARALALQAWLLADDGRLDAAVDATRVPHDERADRAAPEPPRSAMPAPDSVTELSHGETNGNGNPEGLWTFFHENGARREQGTFVDGVREGRWRGWNAREQLTWEGDFHADHEEGRWRAFHRDGSLLLEGFYVRGVRTGTWTWFHPGGGPSEIGDYRDGQPDGLWRAFHPSGLVLREGVYAVGRRVGRWQFWRADGRRSRVVEYGDDGRERR